MITNALKYGVVCGLGVAINLYLFNNVFTNVPVWLAATICGISFALAWVAKTILWVIPGVARSVFRESFYLPSLFATYTYYKRLDPYNRYLELAENGFVQAILVYFGQGIVLIALFAILGVNHWVIATVLLLALIANSTQFIMASQFTSLGTSYTHRYNRELSTKYCKIGLISTIPIVGAFYANYVLLKIVITRLPRWLMAGIEFLWEGFTFLPKTLGIAIAKVHSYEMLVCLFDGCLGYVISYFVLINYLGLETVQYCIGGFVIGFLIGFPHYHLAHSMLNREPNPVPTN